jgi:spore coat polysaccharide biosynthesis predicted glycosyltransferase SpsG
MNILIVCHAGAGVGLGHLARSVAAARALKEELGANVCLLIQGDRVRRRDLETFEHRFIDRTDSLLDAIAEQVRRLDASAVILDLHSRLVPADIGPFLHELRQSKRAVISVDGLADQRANLDLHFVPSFRPSPAGSEAHSRIVSGWDCFLLDVKSPPIPWKPGKRVLALTGGSDATRLGDVLPLLLDTELPAGTELHWVTGPYARPPVLPATPRCSIRNHQSPADLNDLMAHANYALTVYGVSFFELLYYGAPTVVFSPYGNKDDAELDTIASEAVALRASDEVDAVAKLKRLMADDALAASLSRRARQKLSVLGGRKLAQAVARLLG